MNDKTDYQELTDICFENGGVSKPMVDKLSAWHTRKLKEAVLTELNQAREWCAGGQNCEYEKLVDRITELKESTDER